MVLSQLSLNLLLHLLLHLLLQHLVVLLKLRLLLYLRKRASLGQDWRLRWKRLLQLRIDSDDVHQQR